MILWVLSVTFLATAPDAITGQVGTQKSVIYLNVAPPAKKGT